MKLFKYSILTAFLILFSSCATAPRQPKDISSMGQVSSQAMLPFMRQDIYHVIGPGETLWRISKMYDVSISDIMKSNELESDSRIVMGQELLIPNAAPIRPVIPLYNNPGKWRYIIIHHSATDEGNAFSFYNMHLRRGFDNGLGYHFVIDNGTSGKSSGQIEISPRWIKQQNGAHCRAASMNEVGIGVCLVGNFDREDVSAKQMDSLVYLVNILRKYYKIPKQNIMGHGQVPGAATDCPGARFPWERFLSRINSGD